MTADELQQRTFQFAVSIVQFCRLLPADNAGSVVGRQLMRCGTSVGANYRAARRSRSRPEFAARMAIVLEESDESEFWLALIVSSELARQEKADALIEEARELRAIFSRTVTTVREKGRSKTRS